MTPIKAIRKKCRMKRVIKGWVPADETADDTMRIAFQTCRWPPTLFESIAECLKFHSDAKKVRIEITVTDET